MRVFMLDGGDRTPYLSRLVQRLARLGVVMHYAGDPAWKDFDALAASGVTCHEIHINSKLDYRSRWKIRRLLRTHKIDILHTITGRDAYVGIRARGRAKGLRCFARRGAYAKVSRWDPTDWIIYGKGGADRFLMTSKDLARYMVEHGAPADRVTTVYTGIWSDEVQPQERDLRAEHGLPKDVPLWGFVGKLRPVKGFDLMLDGLALLAKKGAPFHLLVAGEGYEAARGDIAERGLADRVTLLGHRKDVMSFLPNLDLMVMTSRIDAAPRAAIEATVVGTPVVATAVGGIPEILDGGRAGVLVPPRDPEALAAALERAIEHPDEPRALAAKAQPRNRDLFSVERCAQTHLELYRR